MTMTGFAFRRVYHLQVINKIEDSEKGTRVDIDTSSVITDFLSTPPPLQLSETEEESELIRITEVTAEYSLAEIDFNRMTAKIKFSSESSSASADTHSLSLFNLDRKTIESLRTEGAKIILRAGYKEQYPTRDLSEFPEVFKGEVVSVKVKRVGNDTMTELTLSSAMTERKTARMTEGFKPTDTLGTVLRTIASHLDVPLVLNILWKENIPIGKHKTWSGEVLEVLDRLSKEYGLRVYLYNEVLQITDSLSSFESIKYNPVIEISNEQIKGSLSLSVDNLNSTPDENSVEVEFTSFLEPRIKLGSIVKVDVEGKSGEYEVVTIMHNLDTHGGPWDTRVIAKGLKVQESRLDYIPPTRESISRTV